MATEIHTICDLAPACLFGLNSSSTFFSQYLPATLDYILYLYVATLISTSTPLPVMFSP